MSFRQCPFLCLLFLALLAFVGSGCSNPSTQSTAPTGPLKESNVSAGPPKESKSDTVAELKTPGDESFTSDQYVRNGLPAPDRDWSGEDMLKAAQNLALFAKKAGFRSLPRYKSERSGEMFARLTSPQNLNMYRNRKLPLETRLPQALIYYQANGQILKFYLTGFAKKEVRDSEMVELLGSLLRSTVVILELVDELLPTIKKDDPKYQVRMQGIEQMKQGLASVVAGGLQTLTEREGYRGSELVRLVECMKETFPIIVPRLLPAARTETLLRLEKMQTDPALKDLQPGLGELRTKVNAVVEKKAAP